MLEQNPLKYQISDFVKHKHKDHTKRCLFIFNVCCCVVLEVMFHDLIHETQNFTLDSDIKK